MAGDRFKVVLSGELDGDREAVRDALATLFKLSAEEATRLLDAAPVTVKRGLDEDTAAKYRAAIEQTGARCEVRPDNAEPDLPAVAPAPPPPPDTVPPAPAGAAPGADAAPPVEGGVHAPAKLPVGRAVGWLGEAWLMFKRAPVTWVLMWVVFAAVVFLAMLVPIANIVAGFLLPPLLTGGVMYAAHVQRDGGDAGVGQLFEGFSRRPGPLLGIGGIYILLSILAFVVIAVLAFALGLGGAFMQELSGVAGGADGAAAALAASGGAAVFALLVLAVSLLVYGAIWFAPALVLLGGLGAVEACKQSLLGCLRNWLVLLVFAVLATVLVFLAMVPMGLGMLVLGPVLMLTIFVGYREIFVE